MFIVNSTSLCLHVYEIYKRYINKLDSLNQITLNSHRYLKRFTYRM